MKKIFCLFLGLLMFSNVALFCSAYENSGKSITDLKDYPYSPSVVMLYSIGVVNGYDDGTYKPSNQINRAEFLKILMTYFNTVSNSKIILGGNNCFSDVKDEWFAEYVCAAHDKGIIDGYSDGTFKPQASISFAEASKILSTVADSVGFSKKPDDTVGDPWYKKYAENLADKKAIPFTITGLNHLVTRGEMAEIAVDFVNPNNTTSLSYDDVASISNLSEKDNFAYRFQKIYGHKLREDGIPDGLDYGTFQRIMLGTSVCGSNANGGDGCELVESELYRDENRIYDYPPDKYEHKLTVLEGADAKTFEVHPDALGQYASDKDNYYVTDKENPFYHKSDKVPAKTQIDFDKAHFDVVYESSIGSFVKDTAGFYYVLDDYKNPRKIDAFNADKFKLIGDIGSVVLFSDDKNLYMAKQMKSYLYTSADIIIKKLDYVDLSSFELLKSTFGNTSFVDYFKDKNKVYYFGSSENVKIAEGFYYTVSNEFLSEVTGIDAGTLKVIQPNGGLAKEQYFKDKNGVYFGQNGKMIKFDGADNETFEIIFVFKDFDKFSPAYPGYYLKDKNNIWVLNPETGLEKLKNVSPEGFDYSKYLQDKGVKHWEEKGG